MGRVTDDAEPEADAHAHAETAGLTALGRRVTEPLAHLECFAAPPGCTSVTLTSDEVTSLCPVTGQPDFSSVAITYEPSQRCIESKSLKLYLWSFRNRPVFAEALAAEIAAEVARAAAPRAGSVTVTQRPRGGITIETTARLR